MYRIEKINENDCEIINYTHCGDQHLIIPDTISGLRVVSIQKASFLKCTCTGDLVIPDTVEIIHPHAFSSSLFTGNLTLSKNLKYIDTNAFWMCKFTGPLVIPRCTENIGDFAFHSSKA